MGSAVWWTLILIVIVIAGFVAAMQVKKWAGQNEEGGGENFTLSDLRRLHKSGQMSTEEYEKARAAIVALAERSQPKPAAPAPKARLGSSDDVIPPPI